jgi:hypothetical protein
VSRRLKLASASESIFTEETILQVAEDLKSGRNPLARTTISDDLVTGLKAECFRSGSITWHVHCPIGDGQERRLFMKIGTLNDKKAEDYLSLKQARDLAKVIKTISATGTDLQDGLLRRLIFELKRDGVRWALPKGMA